MSNEKDQEKAAITKKNHPDFTIICDKCGSKNVIVDNSLGYSPESGSWGSIALLCVDCANHNDLYSN